MARHPSNRKCLPLSPANLLLRPKTGAIDDLHRAVSACKDEQSASEGKSIVEGLAKLKYELQHNRPLT